MTGTLRHTEAHPPKRESFLPSESRPPVLMQNPSRDLEQSITPEMLVHD